METTAVLILVATAASVTFTLLFGLRSRWYTNLVGRMQMNKSFSLSLSLLLITATTLFGNDYPHRELIRNIVYGYLAASLWIQVVVLTKIQNEKPQGEGSMSTRHEEKV